MSGASRSRAAPSTPRWWRGVLSAAGAGLTSLAWWIGVRRRIVLANLRRAFPERTEAERRAIARATYRNLGRMVPEFLLAPRMTRQELDRIFVYEGVEAMEAARAQGRGLIACTAHFGNFELLAAVHNLRGVPITMISRKMGRSKLKDLWRGARRRAGVEDLVVRKGETFWAARRALGRGRVLGYVIDQNQPRHRAIFPTFFGVPAATSPTPAVLAMRTGAPVFFVLALPLGDGRHRVIYDGPLALPRTGSRAGDALVFMQALNDRLEGWIRKYPEQWYWLHRRWKTRPEGESPPLHASEREPQKDN